ncbi:DUF6531 domain-containing protein [Nocardia sp. NPDC003963]
MVVPGAFARAGIRLSAIAETIAKGWSRHSPNHEGKLTMAAGQFGSAEALGTAALRDRTPSVPMEGARSAHSVGSGRRSADDRVSADRGLAHAASTGRSETNRTAEQVTACNDPVDVATGEFILPETDVQLPGVLPLILRRRHRSGYRFGRWFGPSWSATLDMRVVVETANVTFVGDDGLLLVYPHPEPGGRAFSLNGGPAWPLAPVASGGYRVTDPDREMSWDFTTPEPGTVDRLRGGYLLSRITDRHENTIDFRYDEDGVPVAVEHCGGYRVRIDCASGRVAAMHLLSADDAGETVHTVREFGYREGDLRSVRTGVGAVTRYTYDTEHRMESWTDSNDNRMRNSYDDRGRVVAQHGSAGVLDARFEYTVDPVSGSRRTRHFDSTGAATEYALDREFRLCELIDPLGARTRTEYAEDRRPVRVIAADGTATEYRYSTEGDPVEVIRPDGLSVRIAYDTRRRPVTLADADGGCHTREWDSSGVLVAVVAPGGVRTGYTHHESGAVATITESTGAVTGFEVDPAGLPVRITDAHGAVTTIVRDYCGRPVTVTDAVGGTTSYVWSADDRLIERTDADGHRETWTYDGEGNLVAHTDRRGGRTRYSYGAFDLLKVRIDPDGATTRYLWDTQCRLVGVTNPSGDTWRYEYDAAGRRTTETDYAGAPVRYTYDSRGRVATVTPATGIARIHSYDVLGRLTSVMAESGDWLRYTYDVSGRLATAISGAGETVTHTVRYTRSATGQTATEQVDDRLPSVSGYDRHGHRTSYTTPSRTVTSWRHDPAGRVTGMRVGGRRFDFTYDRLGRTTGWGTGDLTIGLVYSGVGYTLRQTVAGADPDVPMRRDDYHWRPDGYPTTQTTVDGAAAVRRDYALDEIGRITGIVSGGRTVEQYSYDRLGNILTAGPGAGEFHSPPGGAAGPGTRVADRSDDDSHREYRRNVLVRRGRTRFHYDASGRLIRSTTRGRSRPPRTRHYRYNAFDQLTELRTATGERWRYTYDALGRRTAKQRLARDGAALEQTDYTWDGNRLVEQTTRQATTHWTYRPGTHIPLTQSIDRDGVDPEFVAIVTDLVGAPVQLRTETGHVAATATTTLWGETTWSGRADTVLRYPGQQYDAESGLHYNLHRTYDPADGRYLTQDPLGLGPAPNPRAYPHNPTTWCDPLGLVPYECESGRTHRDFAHGTSADHAEYIRLYGLNQQVARTATRGGLRSRRGSFFTHEVEGSGSPGFQAAYEWGLRHAQDSPSTVLVGRLPEATYQDLVRRDLVTVRPVGNGVPDETIFAPGAFVDLNNHMEWIAKVTPGHDT